MQLPARIGKYELEEFLGGGMSHVYRARDTVIGRTVAVKILTEAGCADADTKARFLQEARMAGNIAHDNIIRIHDFGEDDQHRPFMVMEFLRGEDLRQAIRSGHTGEVAGKLKIALQIARALEYIHTQKIIHRDIKPENVHINTTGAVKLMDFGIAKSEGMSMTKAGFVLGTPYYMAPEQVLGKEVTDLVDVYAFGILLFELMTGEKPITGESLERIFYAILNEPLNLEPLKQACVDERITSLIARCTAKDPSQRPQGFGPVCSEIERILQPEPPPPAPVKSGRRLWLPAIAIVAVMLAGAAGYFALRRPAPPPRAVSLSPTISTPAGEMVLVPAGTFLFGEKKEPVALPAFYIDKTEVTNAAYAQFASATRRALPPEFPRDRPDYPAVDITIVDAGQFAHWAGKRLPTSREWEKAARGTDGRLYPWGNEADSKHANVAGSGLEPVNAHEDGASPAGALQMVGNVWEFVDQLSAPGPQALGYFRTILNPPPGPGEPWYAIRGESFKEPLADSVMWDSTTVPARWHDKNIGFRCVK